MARPRRIAAWTAHAMIIGLVAVWGLGVVTDRYYRLVGEDIRFGLRERPLTFAHEAARFAGRPGLPDRALVFHLGQAGVYVYHNGPERKVFMDGRLEVPSLLHVPDLCADRGLAQPERSPMGRGVSRLGDPLILIGHEGWSEAEATLLAHPRWRCVYFDEVASVFVPRRGPSSAPGYPGFRLRGRCISSGRRRRPRPVEPRAALARRGAPPAGLGLRRRGGDPWRFRIPMLIRGIRPSPREWLSGERRSGGLEAAGPHRVGNGARPDAPAAGTGRPLGPGHRAPLGPCHLLLPPRPRERRPSDVPTLKAPGRVFRRAADGGGPRVRSNPSLTRTARPAELCPSPGGAPRPAAGSSWSRRRSDRGDLPAPRRSRRGPPRLGRGGALLRRRR